MLLPFIFAIVVITISYIIGLKSKAKRRIGAERTELTSGNGGIEDLDLALESLISKCTSDLDRLRRDSSSAAVELLPYKEQLEGVLKARLSLAVDRWDHPTILRFVKLFKPLGLEEKGLQIFVSYLRKVVATRSADRWVQLNGQPNDNYEARLRKLLQDIVSAIEENDEILMDLCGEDGIVYAICELQKECDSRGSNILLEFMYMPVYSYTEHLPDAKNIMKWWCFRDYLYGMCDLREFVGKVRHLLAYSYNKDLPDLTEIELHIQEVISLAQLCEHYMENMKSKIKSLTDPELESKATDAITKGCFSEVSSDISNFYVGLECFFMEKNVLKAIYINECKPNSIISSVVDDVFFYVMWTSISRAISSSSTTCVNGVLNYAADLLTGVYSHAVNPNLGVKQILRVSMTTLKKKAEVCYSSAGFAKALNDYEVSIENTSKLLDRIEEQRRENVQKAIQINERMPNSISSMADDVLDVLRTDLRWPIYTYDTVSVGMLFDYAADLLRNVHSVAAKVNLENVEVMQTLEELVIALKKNVQMYVICYKKLASRLKENVRWYDISSAELAMALNNYEVSIEYTSKLLGRIEEQCREESWEHDRLASVREHFEQCLSDGRRQLVDNVESRIKPILESVETIVSDGEAIYDKANPWAQRLIDALDTNITCLEPLMTETDYDTCTYHFIRLIVDWFLDKSFTPDFLESKHEEFSGEINQLLSHLWSMARRPLEGILDDQVEQHVHRVTIRIKPILQSVKTIGSDDQAIYADEANTWSQRLIGALETNVAWLEPLMSDTNYDTLAYRVILPILNWLHHEIFPTLSVNESGPEQLLENVSKLVGHLSRIARRPIENVLDVLMEKLAATVTPRIGPILESVRTIGSDGKAISEEANTWVQRLIDALETNVARFKPHISATGYDKFAYFVTDFIVTKLDHIIIFSLNFSEVPLEQLREDIEKLDCHLKSMIQPTIIESQLNTLQRIVDSTDNPLLILRL